MLLNQVCAFVDLETTGSSARSEAITEIGLRLYHPEGDQLNWQQLVNPGKSIPGFIQQLTGISNAMVSDQPDFTELAPSLYEMLEDVLLIAHNARFDYSFLKAAFAHCGFTFKPKVVCTVKLSRELYPQYKSHSLDSVCERMGYVRETSHRAMADVEAMCAFVEYAIAEHGVAAVNSAAQAQFKRPSQPIHISTELIDAIPKAAGVYRFYGEDDSLLYIGKSINLNDRVKSHFNADLRNSKEMRLSQEVRDLDWTVTVGELGALLLENQEIKTKSPIYNRRLRRYRSLWCFELVKNERGVLLPLLGDRPFGQLEQRTFSRQLYGMFQGRTVANKWLKELIAEHRLCKKLLGFEKGSGSCFNYQLKKCAGVCVEQESVSQHNMRLLTAFDAEKVQQWPFDGPAYIVECAEDYQDSEHLAQAIHVIDQWAYLGCVDHEDQIEDMLSSARESWFDKETYRLLNRHIHLAKPIDAGSGRYFEACDEDQDAI